MIGEPKNRIIGNKLRSRLRVLYYNMRFVKLIIRKLKYIG